MPQFDHDTISDVILHLRYTAREGGMPLRTAAVANLTERVAAATTVGSVRLLSVRQDFPTEWARFTSVQLGGAIEVAPLTVTLREEHYPFWAQGLEQIELKQVELYAQPGLDTDLATVTVYDDPAGTQVKIELTSASIGNLVAGATTTDLPAAVGPVTWYLDNNSMGDLWIGLTWGAED